MNKYLVKIAGMLDSAKAVANSGLGKKVIAGIGSHPEAAVATSAGLAAVSTMGKKKK